VSRTVSTRQTSTLALRATAAENGADPERRRFVGGAAAIIIGSASATPASAMEFPKNLFDLGNDAEEESPSGLPVKGSESIMKKKKHGTSDKPVMKTLRYGVDNKLADQICNYNRHVIPLLPLHVYATVLHWNCN
jgi:hypothetical protein